MSQITLTMIVAQKQSLIVDPVMMNMTLIILVNC